MRKLLSAAVIIGVLGFLIYDFRSEPAVERTAAPVTVDQDTQLASAIAGQRSGAHVEARGTVDRVLSDDNNGSRHQRFIVRLPSGQTVLIAHNIDIASRIPSLQKGNYVEFSGDYEWNEKGGVIHWTHRDPQGQHRAGWIKYGGQLFQ